MPRVSAIVPIYGEKHLERCIRSLLGQTLDDLEFIFVDDRSPDSAYDLLLQIIAEEQYAPLRDNIKIVRHPVNRGVPAVRRTGLENSSGDYIYQCDSDDWLDKDMLRKLWEKAVEGGHDMVECNFYVSDGQGDDRIEPFYEYDKDARYWPRYPGTSTLWNKIFRRDVYLNEISWPVNPYWEDYTLLVQLMYYSPRQYYMEEPLYYYYVNPEGIMKRLDPRRKVKGITDQMTLLEDFTRRHGIYDLFKTRFLLYKSEAMVDAWDLPRREFLQVFPEDRLKVLLCGAVPLEKRLGIITKLLGIHGIRGKKRG